jgi:predicted kinase
MEAVVLCGIQGSGKTTLYRDRYAATHVRISLDELGTRPREAAVLAECLARRAPVVIDSTNPTPRERALHLTAVRAAGYRAVCVLVEVDAALARARNATRDRPERIPAGSVAATARRFVRPAEGEGFDELLHATAAPGGGWRVEPLVTTPPLF